MEIHVVPPPFHVLPPPPPALGDTRAGGEVRIPRGSSCGHTTDPDQAVRSRIGPVVNLQVVFGRHASFLHAQRAALNFSFLGSQVH